MLTPTWFCDTASVHQTLLFVCLQYPLMNHQPEFSRQNSEVVIADLLQKGNMYISWSMDVKNVEICNKN